MTKCVSILQVSDSGPQHGRLSLLSGEVVRPQLRLNQHLVTACRRFNHRAAAMTGGGVRDCPPQFRNAVFQFINDLSVRLMRNEVL
jgi:hypothetical protein